MSLSATRSLSKPKREDARVALPPEQIALRTVRGALGLARHKGRIIVPAFLIRASRQNGLKGTQDRAELAVVHANDDSATSMGSPGLRPFLGDARKIAQIEGDHDAPLSRSEREELIVSPAVQGTLFVRSPDVVARLAERHADAARREMGVEKEAHLRLKDVDGWE